MNREVQGEFYYICSLVGYYGLQVFFVDDLINFGFFLMIDCFRYEYWLQQVADVFVCFVVYCGKDQVIEERVKFFGYEVVGEVGCIVHYCHDVVVFE